MINRIACGATSPTNPTNPAAATAAAVINDAAPISASFVHSTGTPSARACSSPSASALSVRAKAHATTSPTPINGVSTRNCSQPTVPTPPSSQAKIAPTRNCASACVSMINAITAVRNAPTATPANSSVVTCARPPLCASAYTSSTVARLPPKASSGTQEKP